MATYSFQDVVAAISGIGGSFPLAYGAGTAEEGITVEAVGDKSTMVIGADGSGMHSLAAGEASTVSVKLLKTSPVNAMLQTMYHIQTHSSITHGRNIITIVNVARGDSITLTGVAFKKRPAITYAKEGGTIEWTFDATNATQILGVGTPEL